MSEFREGSVISGAYIMKDVRVATASNGNPFTSGTLTKNGETVPFKIWDALHPDLVEQSKRTPMIVEGKCHLYNGQVQVVISSLRCATPEDNVDLSELLPTAPIDVKKALKYCVSVMESMTDADYKRLFSALMARYGMAIERCPAAKSAHHAFLGGLMMHTSNMMCIGVKLAKQYDFLNKDLLLTGIFAHDLAKTEEFLFNEFGLVSDYSVKGNLLGHLVMGAMAVEVAAKSTGCPEEKALLVEHMLLSHHGKPKYGAAVAPKFAEAELLYLIDTIDSRMEIYREVGETLESGTFSSSLWQLDGRKIYKPKGE